MIDAAEGIKRRSFRRRKFIRSRQHFSYTVIVSQLEVLGQVAYRRMPGYKCLCRAGNRFSVQEDPALVRLQQTRYQFKQTAFARTRRPGQGQPLSFLLGKTDPPHRVGPVTRGLQTFAEADDL